MIVECSVLAECLNLSGAGINQLVREGMPSYAHGLYDLGACIQWYIENRIKAAGRSGDVVDARRRVYGLRTHKTELESAQIRAATIEADLYLRDLQQLTAIIGRALTQPDPDLPEETIINDRLQMAVDRVRTRIADDLDDEIGSNRLLKKSQASARQGKNR